MGNKNIYLGSVEADKIYIGEAEVDKIYIGDILIWQNVINWTLTIEINNYVSSATYSINGGASVTVSSNTTLTLTDADTVVVTGNKPSDTAQYSYGSVTGGGTFSYNGSPMQTCSLSCTRTLKSYTITLNGTYCSWSRSTQTAYYGDTLSVSGTQVTCTEPSGSIRWQNTATANPQTDQWTYGTPSISNGIGTVTGARTITATSTRSERYYNVSFINASVGSWNSTASISAPYSAIISVSGNTVTVNGKSRTYGSLPSTSITTSYNYYLANIGITNGTQVGTGKTVRVTIGTTNKPYGITLFISIRGIFASTSPSLMYMKSTATSGFSAPTQSFYFKNSKSTDYIEIKPDAYAGGLMNTSGDYAYIYFNNGGTYYNIITKGPYATVGEESFSIYATTSNFSEYW